jgi:Na+/H+-dicarboxylate symporter
MKKSILNISAPALHWQILGAIVLAALAGIYTTPDSFAYHTYAFLGSLFLDALKMIVVPLIAASIVCAVMEVGGGDFGRLGSKTVIFYVITTSIAAATGLILVNLIAPGVGREDTISEALGVSAEQVNSALDKVVGRDLSDMVDIVLRIVPDNIVHAAAHGEILGIIFFSVLFGFFITRLQTKQKELMQEFWRATLSVIMAITQWVLLFAPLGVFGLIAKIVADTGFSAFLPMLSFFFTVFLALAIHVFISQSLVLRFYAGINPIQHLRAMAPALLTAFSTASSSATLPVTIGCVRNRVGVSKRTTGFVLPLGSTVNMDGTALYECVAVMFIAQIYGVDLSVTAQVLIVITALLTSIGVAGIPAASLVAIGIIMTALGLPIEGIGLLLVTDRVLDMLRTATNIYGDSVGAASIAKSEKEKLSYKY